LTLGIVIGEEWEPQINDPFFEKQRREIGRRRSHCGAVAVIRSRRGHFLASSRVKKA
jgi:hypothetical protein